MGGFAYITVLTTTSSLLIGYFRCLERGGKPEFVGICNIPISTTLIHPNIKEVSHKCNNKEVEHPQIFKMEGLFCLCERYLSDRDIKLSIPLEYLLSQLKEMLKDTNSDAYSSLRDFWNLQR